MSDSEEELAASQQRSHDSAKVIISLGIVGAILFAIWKFVSILYGQV